MICSSSRLRRSLHKMHNKFTSSEDDQQTDPSRIAGKVPGAQDGSEDHVSIPALPSDIVRTLIQND